jgi:ribosomal protein S18 acetylase RimI-like enzyme
MSDQKEIGYLKVNEGAAQTELKNLQALEIERIYVKKEFQDKKVGQLLFEKALELAKLQGAPYIWLGVWEKNLKAIRFYKRNGFVEFDKHIFKVGTDEQTDLLMKIDLS